MSNKIAPLTIKKNLSVGCFYAALFLLLFAATRGFSQTTTLATAAQEAYNKGVVAAKLPDYPLAIRYFEEARKAAPQSPEIFFNLGLAESKIPGRELRAICWFKAYLLANPNTPNAGAIKEQMDVLEVKSISNNSRLLNTVEDAANQISDAWYKSSGLEDVAELWIESGDLAAALKTAATIKDLNDKGRALSSVVDAQLEKGDISGAQKTADMIQNSRSKSSALMDIGDAQFEKGDLAGAKKTYTSATKSSEGIESEPDYGIVSKVYVQGEKQSQIALHQAKAGDIAGALKTADLIQIATIKSPAQRSIAEVQIKAGDIAGAQKTLTSALKTADLIDEAHYKSKAQAEIAETRINAGDVAGAQAALASAQKSGELINDEAYKGLAQSAIAKAQAVLGDVAGGLKTADLIKEAEYKAKAYTAIYDVQAKTSDKSGAQKTLLLSIHTANLLNDYRGWSALWMIAYAQAGNGDFVGAQKTTDSIADAKYRGYAQSSVDEAKANAGTPAMSVISVSDFLKKLDDDNMSNDCPLNTGPFLDLASHLKSFPTSDAHQIFKGIYEAADKIIKAQNIINGMLKQPTGK